MPYLVAFTVPKEFYSSRKQNFKVQGNGALHKKWGIKPEAVCPQKKPQTLKTPTQLKPRHHYVRESQAPLTLQPPFNRTDRYSTDF